eukprot:317368-Prymnesium_polylepis.2
MCARAWRAYARRGRGRARAGRHLVIPPPPGRARALRSHQQAATKLNLRRPLGEVLPVVILGGAGEVAAVDGQRLLAPPPVVRPEHAEHILLLEGNRDPEDGATDEVAQEEDAKEKLPAARGDAPPRSIGRTCKCGGGSRVWRGGRSIRRECNTAALNSP